MCQVGRRAGTAQQDMQDATRELLKPLEHSMDGQDEDGGMGEGRRSIGAVSRKRSRRTWEKQNPGEREQNRLNIWPGHSWMAGTAPRAAELGLCFQQGGQVEHAGHAGQSWKEEFHEEFMRNSTRNWQEQPCPQHSAPHRPSWRGSPAPGHPAAHGDANRTGFWSNLPWNPRQPALN